MVRIRVRVIIEIVLKFEAIGPMFVFPYFSSSLWLKDGRD